MIKHEIIFKLNPSIKTISGDIAYDADGNEVAYDKAAVQAYVDRKSTRLNSSHVSESRMPSSA